MKAVIYCRVSTEEQAQINHYSLDTQKELCSELATRLGYTVARVFEDAGKSGSSIESRHAFLEMIKFAKDEKINAVIVLDGSRFARNARDHLAVQEDLSKAGVKLISYSNPTMDYETPDGKLMNLFLAGVSAHHSDSTKFRTKQGLERKALSGWFPSWAPLGYKNITQENGSKIIVIDPIKAPLVKMAFDLYMQGGLGVKDINDILYEKGLRSRNNKKVNLSKMHELLQNPFYIGKFRYNKKVYDGKHEPIISIESFEMAQKIRQSRSFKSYKRKYDFLLNGYLYCQCGRRLTAENHFKPSGKSFRYYHCTRGKECSEHKAFRCEELETVVQTKFMDIQFSEEFYGRLIEKLKSYYNTHVVEVNKEITGVTKSREELIKKRDNAEFMLLEGTIDKEVYQRLNSRLSGEICAYDSELHRLGKTIIINIPIFEDVVNFAKDVFNTFKEGGYELKRSYLDFFWDRFVVDGNGITAALPAPMFVALQRMQKPPRNREVSTVIGDDLQPKKISLKVMNSPAKGGYRELNSS